MFELPQSFIPEYPRVTEAPPECAHESEMASTHSHQPVASLCISECTCEDTCKTVTPQLVSGDESETEDTLDIPECQDEPVPPSVTSDMNLLLEKHTFKQLRQMCKSNRMSQLGTKSDMAGRLTSASKNNIII